MQYLTIASRFDVQNANRDAGVQSFAFAWIVVMMVALLGTFVVEKGKWIQLRPHKDKEVEASRTPASARGRSRRRRAGSRR